MAGFAHGGRRITRWRAEVSAIPMLRTMGTILLLGALAISGASQTKRHTARPEKPATIVSAVSADRAVQQAIQEVEMKWLDALVRRDQATVAEILAPEFHDTTMTGQ